MLEDADRIVGAEDGDRAGQPDPLRALRRGGEDDRGRGHDEVRPVVLAHSEDIQPDLVGQLDLLDEIPGPLRRAA